ncbi:hypothetical protein COCSADRAFT_169813 [Bipolaris sorokiniana ND90Pr]|uniref:Uncharacterized protein n=1 Tax=Cochliobolus sativus (strain ND90Pr / ATCC 201652) TaxID=665912 RepID=M2SDD7_COCSN|nr:uncharacterized protein COCSADRAFT_169813 [Bipolaris sorokiniana ND90Pr]EMD65323.1 hypothetical protein COCSADRAFT_169813 [Bipolaris sorokiniana ND90Pr]
MTPPLLRRESTLLHHLQSSCPLSSISPLCHSQHHHYTYNCHHHYDSHSDSH